MRTHGPWVCLGVPEMKVAEIGDPKNISGLPARWVQMLSLHRH